MTPARSRARRPLRAALLAVALSLTAACGGGGAKDGGGDGAGPVRIGLAIPLTGAYHALAPDTRNGFQTYLDAHDGELGGREVELIVADEGDGASTAVPSVTRLVKHDRVVAVVGLLNAGSVTDVAPLLNENRIPMIGTIGRPELADLTRVWHTGHLSEEPGVAVAPYLKEHVDGPVYAIGPDYQGGWDQLRGFTETYARVGGVLANPDGEARFTPWPDTTDFTPYFTEIRKSGAKAVYCFYAGTTAVDFVEQYRRSDVKDLPLYGAGLLTEGAVLGTQGDTAKGVYTSLNYAAGLDNPANREFTAAYQAKYDQLPTMMAMTAYDAAAVLDKAIGDVRGELTPEALNDAIGRVGKVDSPRGAWEFAAGTHAPVQKWYLRQVRPDGNTLGNILVQELTTLGG